jgi:hypothetical protein
VLVRAAALHRSDEAFEWLVGLVAEGETAIATEVVDVLSIYRHNEKLAERLARALAARLDEAPTVRFEQLWA